MLHLQTTAGECVCPHLKTSTDDLCKILWLTPNGSTCYRKASFWATSKTLDDALLDNDRKRKKYC